MFGKDAIQRRRYVDSFGEARLVRQQFEEQGAAGLLAAWGDEKTHMERLYGNALEEMKDLKLTPFVTLTADQRAQLTRSIVWMEARVVNGEEVLVPVLYLSPQELAKLGRESAQITGQSVSLESPEVSASGLIHGLTTTHVKGQRVTLTGARVDGEDTLVDADLLTNNSSTIAGDTTTINAATFIAQTLVDRMENAFGYTDVARSQAQHTARRGKLTINTGDMAFMGVANHGNQGVDVTSQGTQNLGAQTLSMHMELKRKGYEFTRHRERNLKTTFTTGTAPGADVRIHSHGAAVHEGVDATASGKVTKTGDSTFKEKIVYDVDHEESKLRKKGGGILGKKRKHDAIHYDKTANRSKLTAGEDITLRFKDDVTVEPIQARSGGKITLKSDEGKTHMATAKEEHVHTSNKSSTDKLWESKSNEGASHDRVLIADLQGAEGEVIEGAKGVILPQVKQRFSKTDGKKKKGKEQVHEAFKDLSQEPGSRYLKTASQQPNVSYETDTENHQEWSMKSQQITAAAKVIVTLIVTIVTMGSGALFAGAGTEGIAIALS